MARVAKVAKAAKVPKAAKAQKAQKVAVVAGSTRGAGRGIARALGEAGCIVYCTGRSVTGKPSPYNRPETIDETAALVTAAGGTGVAVRVDHTNESEVAALFARVVEEHGHLDVLADSVAGEDPLLGGWTGMLNTDFTNAEAALRQSLLSRMITAKQAALVMKARKRGLIVEVTEHDLLGGGGNLVSAIAKSGVKLMANFLADDLRKSRVAVVSLTPGFLRSETMLQHFGVTEANWRDGGKKDPHFLQSESPLFVGRAVAALANDPNVMEKTGMILSSWELGREYGFTDADGRRPDWGEYGRKKVVPSMKWFREGLEHHAKWIDGLATRSRNYLNPH